MSWAGGEGFDGEERGGNVEGKLGGGGEEVSRFRGIGPRGEEMGAAVWGGGGVEGNGWVEFDGERDGNGDGGRARARARG